MFDKIKAGVETAIHSGKIFWSKNSPTILFVAGVVGVIGGTVLACNATLKVPDIIEERNKKLEEINQDLENKSLDDSISESAYELATNEANKQVTKTHALTVLNIGKVYAPAVIVEVVSIAFLTRSQQKIVERYLAVSAAYAALQTEFNLYRNGVKEKYGEEADNELLFGVKHQTIKRISEDGTESEEEIKVFDISKYGQDSMGAVLIFDERSSQWENNYNYNKRYIDLCVYNANEKLNERGRLRSDRKKEAMDDVFLINEIADMMDVPRTVFGAFNGWEYDPNNPTKISYDIIPAGAPVGDNQVMFDCDNPRALIVRFNIDGNVIEKAATKSV